jgi:hypothetical protein
VEIETIRVEKDGGKKKSYQQPKLTVLGDVAEITMADDLGEDLDAVFTTNGVSTSRGRRKKDKFS